MLTLHKLPALNLYPVVCLLSCLWMKNQGFRLRPALYCVLTLSLSHLLNSSQGQGSPSTVSTVCRAHLNFRGTWKCLIPSTIKRKIWAFRSKSALMYSVIFSSVSVQLLHCVWLFATPWTAVHQVSLSITSSQSLLKLMSIELVIPSNHLILCRPLLLEPSIFPSIRVFSNESALRMRWPKDWSFNFNISPSRLISFRMDWLDLIAVQGTLKSLL